MDGFVVWLHGRTKRCIACCQGIEEQTNKHKAQGQNANQVANVAFETLRHLQRCLCFARSGRKFPRLFGDGIEGFWQRQGKYENQKGKHQRGGVRLVCLARKLIHGFLDNPRGVAEHNAIIKAIFLD